MGADPEKKAECLPCQENAASNVVLQACAADSSGIKCQELQAMMLNGEIDVYGLMDRVETKAKDADTKRVVRTVRRYLKR